MDVDQVDNDLSAKLRMLPLEQRRRVLAFVESLQAEAVQQPGKLRSPKGLWADLDVDLSADDIDQVRREMWATFPRDDLP